MSLESCTSRALGRWSARAERYRVAVHGGRAGPAAAGGGLVAKLKASMEYPLQSNRGLVAWTDSASMRTASLRLG